MEDSRTPLGGGCESLPSPQSRTSEPNELSPILSIHGEWTRVTNLFHGAVRIIELAGLTSGSTRIPAAAIVALAALAIVGGAFFRSGA